MLGIFHPLPEELGGAIKKEGVVAVETDVKERCVGNIRRALDFYLIKKALLIGTAAGVNGAGLGDIIMPTSIRWVDGKEEFYPDSVLVEEIKKKFTFIQSGGSFTLPSFGWRSEWDFKIRKGDLIYDLEDYWFAKELSERKIHFAIVRIVSDLHSEKISKEKFSVERLPIYGKEMRKKFLNPFLNL